MVIRARLLGSGTSKELHTVPSQFLPDEEVLVTTTGPQRHGVFQSVNRTSAGTTIITSPDAEGAIVVTDLILSAERAANSTVQIQFTDDTETEIIILTESADSTVNLAIPFVGLWQGWRDARLELVTTGAVNVTAALGYMKVPEGLVFSEWNALR